MTIPFVYILLFAVTAIYAATLERIHDLYSPDYIWVTVVIGNGWIIGAFALLAEIGAVSWAAVWHLIGLSVVAGVPVIAWQVWQAIRRADERRGKR